MMWAIVLAAWVVLSVAAALFIGAFIRAGRGPDEGAAIPDGTEKDVA